MPGKGKECKCKFCYFKTYHAEYAEEPARQEKHEGTQKTSGLG